MRALTDVTTLSTRQEADVRSASSADLLSTSECAPFRRFGAIAARDLEKRLSRGAGRILHVCRGDDRRSLMRAGGIVAFTDLPTGPK